MNYQKYSDDNQKLREELLLLRNKAGLQNKQMPIVEPPTDESDFETEAFVLPADAATPPIAEPVIVEPIEQLDGLFNERKINTWDLVDINYLERGVSVARAVCKLHAEDDDGPLEGSGFLISDRLLVTNHHNLPNKEVAQTASIEFDHQRGLDGIPRSTEVFRLLPKEAYWSDADLDICVVAVAPTSQRNVPLTRYGAVALNPDVGKIKVGQFISLIHHPDGGFKQASMRENRLLRKDDKVLWYASDTTSGSSGAPCFSDKWEVVAIHRKGVPLTDENNPNLIGLRDGTFLTKEQIRDLKIEESRIVWIANEGIRVSVFVDTIKSDTEAVANPLITNWLGNLGGTKFVPISTDIALGNTSISFNESRRPINNYERRNGYQVDFLSVPIPKPILTKAVKKWGATSFNSDTGEAEFPYYNFSVWMSRERRMPFLAVVNIDGQNHNQRHRAEFGNDKWVYDDRLSERLQIGEWFYGSEPARFNHNYFDRGHIVRRTEPTWGSDNLSQLANDDTFHWTNCTPQYKDFNQRSKHWQGLEKYLLEKGAIRHQKRMTIFTGPIFSKDDTVHRTVLIPKQFFKIAVFVDNAGELRSAGYVLDQSQWVEIIEFERAAALDVKAIRKSIKWIEKQTGINFGKAVRDADEASKLRNRNQPIEELKDLFEGLSEE